MKKNILKRVRKNLEKAILAQDTPIVINVDNDDENSDWLHTVRDEREAEEKEKEDEV